MPKSLQAIGNDALQNAPKPLQRVLHGLNMQFQPESGAVSPIAGGLGPRADGMIAGVEQGRPNTISVMKPDVFTKNADQLVTHEGVHSWQNNLPPALQARIPADNPNDPNNYGGTARIADLVKRGGTMLDLPREQGAAALQYGQVHGNPEPYKSLANTMNAIPLSTVDMTDPSAKEINTHPRAPLPPIMNYATDTYKKGQPAPGDDDIDLSAGLSPAHVTTGTVGGHAPDNTPVGVAQGQSNPSAAGDDIDLSAGLSGAQQNTEEPYSMQLLKGIPGAAKSVGKGILEGLGSDAANLTGSTRLKALTTPSGDENDIAGQKFGKGLEQAGEFLIPGLGEERAASLLPKVRGLRPLGKVAYNAITAGALNKAQGGNFKTGAVMGGLGSVGGQAFEEAAPGVAEQALGIRGKFDRSFNKAPGRAVLDEIKGIRPDTIANNARSRINDLSGQVNTLADNTAAPLSLLPARTTLSDAGNTALQRNAASTYGQINDMENMLGQRFGTQQLIPQDVPARELLDLRRGFNDEFGSWNPERKEPATQAARGAYSALTDEFHRGVPEAKDLDARISSLIPVKNRAQIKALGSGTGARVLGRIGAHTGALTGGILGGIGGYEHGGPLDALKYGALGLVAPELMASPEVQMFGARMLNQGSHVLRPLVGGALQFNRPRPKSNTE